MTPAPSVIGVGADGVSYLSNGSTKLDGAGNDAKFAPITGVLVARLPSNVAIGDWDDLLAAVKARLRLIVGEVRVATVEPPLRDTVAWVQDSVLECVAALDQLHSTLANELERRR